MSRQQPQGMKVYRASIPGGHFNMRLPWYKPDNYLKPDGSKAYYWRRRKVRPRATIPTIRCGTPEFAGPFIMAMDRNEINEVFFQGRAIPDPMDYFPPWSDIFKDEWAPFPGPDGDDGSRGRLGPPS